MRPTPTMIDDALRFMDVPPQERHGDIALQVEQTFLELEEVIRPRGVWGRFPVDVRPDGIAVAGFTVPGADLGKLLARCKECFLMAVTLGSEADRAILRAQKRNMLDGMMLDACASVRADAFCDETEAQVMAELGSGEYLTMRYSPGYGDAPLQVSEDIIAALDATRRIGLSMTKSFMMTPVKSITAFIGVSGQKEERARSCDLCANHDTCPYRKKGERCGT